MKSRNPFILTLGIASAILACEAHAGLIITPTFTANFNTNFGANAAAAQAAWNSAASVFTSSFNDNIHINITVDGTATTSPFGQSSTPGFTTTYANVRNLLNADKKSADDILSLGAGGSLTVADPAGGSGNWFVSRSQAKAIGLIADDLANDGTTTFGAGNPWTFSGSVTSGTYDFKGVAAHEISEVMGRLGFKSSTTRSVIDAFSFTGAGTRDLVGGPNNNFSIDDGTTLLKLWNDPNANSLDSRDWAPGTNDAFNQFANSGVMNAVTPVDIQVMDVIGYDLAAVPEPADPGTIFATALVAVGVIAQAGTRKRARAGA
jgi:hypothetical protein